MNFAIASLLFLVTIGTTISAPPPLRHDNDSALVSLYVLGPVTHPGKHKVKPDLSVNEVIEAAGGAEDGVRFGNCRIIRGKREIQIKRVDFGKVRSGRWRLFKANDVIMLSFWRFSIE